MEPHFETLGMGGTGERMASEDDQAKLLETLEEVVKGLVAEATRNPPRGRSDLSSYLKLERDTWKVSGACASLAKTGPC
jgi:hypothetical protein